MAKMEALQEHHECLSGAPPVVHGFYIGKFCSKISETLAAPPLASSASVQDLGALVIEKSGGKRKEMPGEGEHTDISPRGVLDECLRSRGAGDGGDTPTSKTAATSSSSASYTAGASASSATARMGGRPRSLWKGFLRMWRNKSVRRLASLPAPLLHPRLTRLRSSGGRERGWRSAAAQAVDGFCILKPSWRNFSLDELKRATRNFSHENVIGKGGFAKVYRGCLEGGQLVAVKRLTTMEENERLNNFLSELGTIIHVNHPNIAKLVGVGAEGGQHLVFPLSELGSLSNVLHGCKERMRWEARYKVAVGTANGLEYLHERCSRRIIHRDIKAANILLKDDFEPQICDFGLAKWLPEKLTHHQVTVFEGTFGYVAPEYTTHGIINEKTDVFAYGVLLLELITGRKALDASKQSLVMWAKPFLDENNIAKLVDPALGGDYDAAQVNHVARAAQMCIQHAATLRPPMSQVLKMLRGEVALAHSKIYRRTHSVELQDADDYNATRYLSDLNRHKALALDF